MVSLNGGERVVIEIGSMYQDAGVTAIDDRDGDLTDKVSFLAGSLFTRPDDGLKIHLDAEQSFKSSSNGYRVHTWANLLDSNQIFQKKYNDEDNRNRPTVVQNALNGKTVVRFDASQHNGQYLTLEELDTLDFRKSLSIFVVSQNLQNSGAIIGMYSTENNTPSSGSDW